LPPFLFVHVYIVAQIAISQLEPDLQQRVTDYATTFSQEFDGDGYLTSAVWPDRINWQYGMTSFFEWHFLDLPIVRKGDNSSHAKIPADIFRPPHVGWQVRVASSSAPKGKGIAASSTPSAPMLYLLHMMLQYTLTMAMSILFHLPSITYYI
jgi:hypothetical protein